MNPGKTEKLFQQALEALTHVDDRLTADREDGPMHVLSGIQTSLGELLDDQKLGKETRRVLEEAAGSLGGLIEDQELVDLQVCSPEDITELVTDMEFYGYH